MVSIRRFATLRHIRTETHEHVLYYRRGRLVRGGRGLAFWFNAPSAALAIVPAEDCQTDLYLKERSRDFQEVTVQLSIGYRFRQPTLASARFNFGVSIDDGSWLGDPIDHVTTILHQRAQEPARQVVATLEVVDALRDGAQEIRGAIERTLLDDQELGEMGLELVSVQVNAIAPTAELEKALSTPSRESIQQRADEALFSRRALAVDNERAIQENELNNEIELTMRREALIRKEGENRLLEVQSQSAAEEEQAAARHRVEEQAAESFANQRRVRAEAEAAAERAIAEARAEGERQHFEVWNTTDPSVLAGLALREVAGTLQSIDQLVITPELLGNTISRLFGKEANS